MHALDANVESFVIAATSGRCERARRLLDARPEIASDPWARLVLGRGWERDASAPGGPRGWAPPAAGLGADPTASGEDYGAPIFWAALGSQEGHALPGRDYVAVVDQLVAAGAELEESLLEVAEGPLADWLEDHVGAA